MRLIPLGRKAITALAHQELLSKLDLTSERFRAFLAVDVPEGEAIEKIGTFQTVLSQTGADLRLVALENIHITLRFLGDTSRGLVEQLKEELDKIEFSAFKVAFKSVGAFPDQNRVNVVWVGIDKGNVGLIDLSGKIGRLLTRFGIPSDRRGFNPHLTVARVRSNRNREGLLKTVRTFIDSDFGFFEANSFSLKQSTLTPTGPIYRDLQRVMARPSS